MKRQNVQNPEPAPSLQPSLDPHRPSQGCGHRKEAANPRHTPHHPQTHQHQVFCPRCEGVRDGASCRGMPVGLTWDALGLRQPPAAARGDAALDPTQRTGSSAVKGKGTHGDGPKLSAGKKGAPAPQKSAHSSKWLPSHLTARLRFCADPLEMEDSFGMEEPFMENTGMEALQGGRRVRGSSPGPRRKRRSRFFGMLFVSKWYSTHLGTKGPSCFFRAHRAFSQPGNRGRLTAPGLATSSERL